MLVLGICDGHDSGACLVDGDTGALLAAVSSERFSGTKRQPGFPEDAARWCLASAAASPRDVSVVAVAEQAGRAAMRVLDRWYRRTEPSLPLDRWSNLASMAWQNLVSKGDLSRRLEAAVSARTLGLRARALGLRAKVELVDHHLAHAASAAHGSGKERALVVTMDAFGDACSGSVWRWAGERLDLLDRTPFPNSPALLYGLVTCFLGYREGDEGKVSGLAATGDPAATATVFHRIFDRTEDGGFVMRQVPTMGWLERALAGHSDADIAAGVQRYAQDLVSDHVARWARQTGQRHLCLAGGLFANVRLNQAVAEASECEDLYVFPHMGDGGLCAGAAWASAGVATGQVAGMFLGPGEDAGAAAVEAPLDVEVSALDHGTPKRVAELLARGGVVGVVQGPMEFGPRALGNRSLLFPATEPRLAAEVGLALGRPAVMPFAPVVRDVDFAAVASGPRHSATEFMAVTADALPGVARRLPVAVHDDGSLRVQVATALTTPLLYDILTCYGDQMDPAMLINTSYNTHREPIVRTAARAVELFARAPVITALVVGDRLMVKRR